MVVKLPNLSAHSMLSLLGTLAGVITAVQHVLPPAVSSVLVAAGPVVLAAERAALAYERSHAKPETPVK